MPINILPPNPTFGTLLAQALGQGIGNFGEQFSKGRQERTKQEGLGTLLSQVMPKLDSDMVQKIARSGIEAKDLLSNLDKFKKSNEVNPEVKRAKNLLATAKEMKGLLKYTGSGLIPGSGFGGPLNRESVQQRAKFNSLAADFAGFFRELDTKGQLPQGLYDKVIAPRLPNDSLSDRENSGRIEGLEDLARRYGGLDQESGPDSSNESAQVLRARNPETGQILISKDSGKTWVKP